MRTPLIDRRDFLTASASALALGKAGLPLPAFDAPRETPELDVELHQ